MRSQEALTRTLVELADTLVDDFDVVDLLTLLTDRCVELFGVSDAGLLLAAPVGADLRVMASSSITMRDLEVYELQASDGPCLDAYRTGNAVQQDDLRAASASQRWPRFTPAALAAGFRSVTALPMRLRGTTIGGLNLFDADPGPMADDDRDAARAFADVATIAVLQHQAAIDSHILNEQLNHALNSRIAIEQAKGMLAERADLDVNEAFRWLRHYARSHNVRLADLATDITGGGAILGLIEAPPSTPSRA
ncbi:MAG: GAF and ANTAR domain-containing protein [Acidimicrobiales bacterium]|nr:GAF and ANTAR domain-containing protein [Acidimicrobiales bacterium]